MARRAVYAGSMSTASQPSTSIPTPAQAASIVTAASNDPGWGMFVWLAMVAGARSGELDALRWNEVDLDTGVLALGERRVDLDEQTVTLLRAYLAHCAAQAAILGIERDPGAYVFSPTPDGATPPEPGTAAARYARLCAELGWHMDLDELPHHSASELVAGGVDVRSFHWRLQRGLSRIQRRPRA